MQPSAAHELYLQAARTLYIAETVGWNMRLDTLRGLLEDLASRLRDYESKPTSSDAAQAAMPVGTSPKIRVSRPAETR